MSFNTFEQKIKSNISFHTDYYEEIKSFYNFVLDEYKGNEYDFIILTTRRSYVLFKIFEKIRNEAVESNTVIVNNHSLDFFESSFWKNKSVLIVDDILINGRAVQSIVQKTKDAKKHIFVFARNKGAHCLTDDIQNSLLNNSYNVGIVSERKWRDYSSMLNELVLVSGMGYVSFVNTFRPASNESAKLIDKIKDLFSSYSLSNDIYEEKKIDAKVFFLDASVLEKDSFFKYTSWFTKQLSYLKIKLCLRKYTFPNSEVNDEVLIPYAFLPDMTKKQLETLCEKLLLVLPLKSIKLGKDCINDTSSDKTVFLDYIIERIYDNYRALYILLTNLCSSFLMEAIRRDCSTFDADFCIKKILDVDKELLLNIDYYDNFEFRDVSDSASELTYLEQDNNESRECIEQLALALQDNSENVLENQDKFYSVISDYLYRMRTIDQRNAENMERRANGIRVSDIVRVLTKMNPDLDIFKYLDSTYAVMIRCWDSGRGSFVVREFIDENDENVCICSSLINGEQIFIFPFACNYEVSYQFSCFSNMAHTMVPRKLFDFAQFMDERHHTNRYTNSLIAYFSGGEMDYQNGIGNYSIRKSAHVDISDVLDYVMNYYGQGART